MFILIQNCEPVYANSDFDQLLGFICEFKSDLPAYYNGIVDLFSAYEIDDETGYRIDDNHVMQINVGTMLRAKKRETLIIVKHIHHGKVIDKHGYTFYN